MKLSEIENQIQQLEGEIVGIEAALEALQRNLPRPVTPAGDSAFELLTGLMKQSENEDQREAERLRAIEASQEALKQSRARLAEMKAELERGRKELEAAISVMRVKAEEMQALSLQLESGWMELQELSRNPAFHTYMGKNPLSIFADRRSLPDLLIGGESADFKVMVLSLEGRQIFSRVASLEQATIVPITQPETEAA